MKLFRRRAQQVSGCAASRTHAGGDGAPPPEGSYVTDGASLFRVAHAMHDQRGGEVLVELEDCHTLELVLCSTAAMAAMRLHRVTPTAV